MAGPVRRQQSIGSACAPTGRSLLFRRLPVSSLSLGMGVCRRAGFCPVSLCVPTRTAALGLNLLLAHPVMSPGLLVLRIETRTAAPRQTFLAGDGVGFRHRGPEP